MIEARIRQLADGEELISFEDDDWATRPLVDDPRLVLLEHRRAAEVALERGTIATELSRAGVSNRRSAARSSVRRVSDPCDEAHLILLLSGCVASGE